MISRRRCWALAGLLQGANCRALGSLARCRRGHGGAAGGTCGAPSRFHGLAQFGAGVEPATELPQRRPATMHAVIVCNGQPAPARGASTQCRGCMQSNLGRPCHSQQKPIYDHQFLCRRGWAHPPNQDCGCKWAICMALQARPKDNQKVLVTITHANGGTAIQLLSQRLSEGSHNPSLSIQC